MAIERLRQRLSQIQGDLAQAEQAGLLPLNEANTERLVVEPILDALGYHSLDYTKRAQGVGADFPDYTVLPQSDRKWYLEVKEWDARLEERFERQAVNYANNNGAQWAVLTNGKVWWVYNTRAAGTLREMRAYEVADILDTKAAAETLAHLSRESVQGGELDREYRAREVRAAVLSFLRSADRKLIRAIQSGVATQLDRNIMVDDVEAALQAVLGLQTSTSTPPIPEVKVVRETIVGQLGLPDLVALDESLHGTKPASVQFPDGMAKPVTAWRHVVQESVAWLLSQGRVPSLPFSGAKHGKNYFMNAEPVHSNGKAMKTSARFETPRGPIFVDVHRSAPNIVARLQELCVAVGWDPAEFRIELAQ